MNLTKNEIDVILNMLEDIDSMWGMKPEELELYEKLTREEKDND